MVARIRKVELKVAKLVWWLWDFYSRFDC